MLRELTDNFLGLMTLLGKPRATFENYHYVLICVVNASYVLRQINKSSSYLLFLDSGPNTTGLERRNDLADEVRQRLNTMCKDSPFTSETLPLKVAKVPLQDNGFDCGLFVCKYFESMVKDVESFASKNNLDDVYNPTLEFSWTQDDVTILRWNLVTFITTIHVDFFLGHPRSEELSTLKEWRKAKKSGRMSYTIEPGIINLDE